MRSRNHADEIGRNQFRALVNELVIRVLTVRARLSPNDLACLRAHCATPTIDGFAIALHRQLLQVRREMREVVAVRQHGESLCTKEVVVPNADEPEDKREVPLHRCTPEVLIDESKSFEHFGEVVRSDGDHQSQSDR